MIAAAWSLLDEGTQIFGLRPNTYTFTVAFICILENGFFFLYTPLLHIFTSLEMGSSYTEEEIKSHGKDTETAVHKNGDLQTKWAPLEITGGVRFQPLVEMWYVDC